MIRLFNLIIEGGLILLTIFTPLAFGAVEVWAYTVMELIVLIILTAWLLKMVSQGELRLVKSPLNLPLILFIVLILFQLLPLPPSVLKHLSPNTYELYQLALPHYDTENRTLTIYPYATKTELFKLLAYIAIFFIVVNNIHSKTQINRLLLALILVGSFEALYGLLEYLSGHQHIFLYKKIWYTDSATGTYINRNHFAGYLEMVIPLTLGFLFSIFNFPFPKATNWRTRLASLEARLSQNSLLTFAIIIMILGIIFSKSRMGIFSLIASLILMVFLWRSGTGPKRFSHLIWAILIMGLLAGVWIGLNPVLVRFSALSQDLAIEGWRPRVWHDTVQLIKDFPIWGVGLGNYVYLFPKYKTIKDQVLLDHAHNDYLELMAGAGIPGILLMFVAIIFFLRKILQLSYHRHDPYVKGMTLGGITAIIALLFHSLSDFNLHIPANALLFTLILALIPVLAHLKNREGKDAVLLSFRTIPLSTPTRLFLIPLILITALFISREIILPYLAEQYYPTQIGSSRRDRFLRMPPGEQVARLQKAMSYAPDNAELHYQLAARYARLLREAWEKGGKWKLENRKWVFYPEPGTLNLAPRTLAEYQKAIELNPTDAYAHLGLGWALSQWALISPQVLPKNLEHRTLNLAPVSNSDFSATNHEFNLAPMLDPTNSVIRDYLKKWGR